MFLSQTQCHALGAAPVCCSPSFLALSARRKSASPWIKDTIPQNPFKLKGLIMYVYEKINVQNGGCGLGTGN